MAFIQSQSQSDILRVMDELIQFCESEAANLDQQMAQGYFHFPGSNYTSVIKFDGEPILPPLMTEQRREEMLMYKHQAVMVETRLRAHIRQRLLARVKAVMQQIEAKEKGQNAPSQSNAEVTPSESISPSDDESATDIIHHQAEQQILSPSVIHVTAEDPQITQQDELVPVVQLNVEQAAHQNVLQTMAIEETDQHPQLKQDMDNNISEKVPKLLEKGPEIIHIRTDMDIASEPQLVSSEYGQQIKSRVGLLTAQQVESKIFHVAEAPVEDVERASQVPRLICSEDTEVASPRTNTKDSGVFSKTATTIEYDDNTLVALTENTEDDKLHTMADVTDLTDDEESQTPTVAVEGVLVSDHECDSSSVDDKLSYQSQESYQDVVFSDDAENVDAEEDVQNMSLSNSKLGAKERVELLVKKLDTALKYHEKQRFGICTEKSLPSTNSSTASCATVSSEEMNQTVIARDDATDDEQLGQEQDAKGTDGTERSTPELMDGDNRERRDTSGTGDTDMSMPDMIHTDPRPRRDTTGTEETESTTETVEPVTSEAERPETDDSLEHVSQEVFKSDNESPDLKSSLLSRVVFDTPDETSEDLSEHEIQLSKQDSDSQQIFCSTQTVVEVAVSIPSPGPVDTPDLSHISHATEDSKSERSPISAAVKLGGNIHKLKHSTDYSLKNSENLTQTSDSQRKQSQLQSPNDPFVHSMDTSQLYTASTELAPYMENSMDTVPSSLTTLPYVPEADQKNTSGATDSPSGSSLPVDGQPSSQERSSTSQDGQSGERPSLERVRRNSYTLDQPSPVLVAAHARAHRDGNKSPTTATSSSGTSSSAQQPKSKPFNLTSSMEDLKLKPVQRKLDYESAAPDLPKPILKKTPPVQAEHSPPAASVVRMDSKEGKEEHLHRYLQHLSQMPTYQDDGDPSVQEGYTDSVNTGETYQSSPEMPSTDPLPTQTTNQNASTFGLPVDMATLGQMTQEDIVQVQMQYFEVMRRQLMEQQQQQLAHLFAEQERQQLMLQQDIMRHHHQQQVDNVRASLQHQQQQQEDNRRASQKSRQKSNQVQQTNQKLQKEAQNKQYAETQQQIDGMRPYSAPVPRVSFAPSPRNSLQNTNISPSGVYCNQNFPMSPQDGSFMDTSVNLSQQEALDNSYRSPAVLQYSAPNQLAQNTQTSHRYSNQPVYNGHEQAVYDPQADPSHDVYLQPPYELSTDPTYNGHNQHPTQQYSPELLHQYQQQAYYQHQQYLSESMPAGGRNVHADLLVQNENVPASLHQKFVKLTAAARGFLTRKLMQTDKVQQIINTIKDTAEFALSFQQETPIKKGIYSHQDKNLQDRVLAQLTAAMYEFHEVFFETSVKERMAIIHQSRLMEHEKMFKQGQTAANPSRRLSAATKKSIERKKKAKAAEAVVFGMARPKSCPPSTSSPKVPRNMDLSGPIRRNYHFLMTRAMKPIQAQLSPIKPDAETARSEGYGTGRRQLSPRGKTGSTAVKRIQSRPKSAAGKPVKKTSSMPAARKVSRPSSQASKHSPEMAKRMDSKAGIRHVSQAGGRPASQGSRPVSHASRPVSQAGTRPSSQANNRAESQASNHVPSQASSRVLSHISSRIDSGRGASRTTPPSGGNTKSTARPAQMVRQTSQSAKSKTAEGISNGGINHDVHRIIAPSNHAA